jgi:hypothetical protein
MRFDAEAAHIAAERAALSHRGSLSKRTGCLSSHRRPSLRTGFRERVRN